MGYPVSQGLYDPRNEHDACGVGMVAHIKGAKSHAIIAQALEILEKLDHRGAVGADPLLGDGAGILIQIPDPLIRRWATANGHDLPAPGDYAVGMCFLPQDETARTFVKSRMEAFTAKEGQRFVGWRDVPTTSDGLGAAVIASMPVIEMAVIARGTNCADQDAFERKILTIRKQVQNPLAALAEKHGLPGVTETYIPSFSTRTLVYKGLLLATQVGSFYDDLRDPECVSALGLVHQRFSTNTFPSWRLAHPFRFIAHNGEINTVRGNVNWMNARRRTMESELLGPDLDKMWPIIPHGQSDTACLDNALELLIAGGYSLAHAMMMLIPEAWAGNPLMDPARRAFYEYHAALMEPWDGPAAVCFTDGRQIGATLDRNGLRPARYCVTKDDIVCLASESGVLPFAEEDIVRKWRLQPGKMLLIDLEQGRIIEDDELKADLAAAEPYAEWLHQAQYKLEDITDVVPELAAIPAEEGTLLQRQQAFGYTQEDVTRFLEPMAVDGDDPVGSMGTDTPLAVLSNRSRLLYDYFKQNFAQVTNPRGAGDEPHLDDRPAPEPAGPRSGDAQAPRSRPADPHQRGSRQDPLGGRGARRRLPLRHHRHHLGRQHGCRGHCPGDQGNVLGRDRGGAAGSQHPRAVRPRAEREPRAHARAARDRCGAPPPRAAGPAHADRPRGRNRRSARGASLLRAGRLRRGSDQPLSRLRDDRGPAGQASPRSACCQGAAELHQGRGQGHP
jgi:glutamate synthase (NADPH/NADH) large chain